MISVSELTLKGFEDSSWPNCDRSPEHDEANWRSSTAGIETLEFDQCVGSLYVVTKNSFDHVPVNLRGYAFS